MMCSFTDLDLDTVRTIRSITEMADPNTAKGAVLLRLAFVSLLSVDPSTFKGSGRSSNQIRSLPPFTDITTIDGLNCRVFFPIHRAMNQSWGANRTIYALIEELAFAGAERKIQLTNRLDRGMALQVTQYINKERLESLNEDVLTRVQSNTQESSDGFLTTLDLEFTMSALKNFVTQVCDKYLESARPAPTP